MCFVGFLWWLYVLDVCGCGDDVVVDEGLCGLFVDAFVVLCGVGFDGFVVEGVCWVAFAVLGVGVVDFSVGGDVEFDDEVVGFCAVEWCGGFEGVE